MGARAGGGGGAGVWVGEQLQGAEGLCQGWPMKIPDDLRAGDILLYSPSELVGVLIAIKTGGWFSHVECCIGGDQVIAARLQGVDVYATRFDHLCAVRRPLVSFD